MSPDTWKGDDDSVRLDQYGNQVEIAIEEYQVDAGGDMYERHSPETEITLLPPPEA